MFGVDTVTMIFGPDGTCFVTLAGNSNVTAESGSGDEVLVEAGDVWDGEMPGEQANRIRVQKRSVFESLVIFVPDSFYPFIIQIPDICFGLWEVNHCAVQCPCDITKT